MRQITLLAAVLGLGVWLLWWPTLTSLADLGDGKTVVLQGQHLPGWHSDWSRQLVLSNGWSSEKLKLEEDTGWWKGSALYRDAKGEYVLDDGIDFIRFTLCPPGVTLRQSHRGTTIPAAPSTSEAGCEAGALEANAPPSRYHSEEDGLRFLGLFVESRPGLAFKSWRDVAEPIPGLIDAGG